LSKFESLNWGFPCLYHVVVGATKSQKIIYCREEGNASSQIEVVTNPVSLCELMSNP
jgi:hypothetical protein